MIPKVIHYCWFGRNPKSKLVYDCMESWKKTCPDYEIIEWNESNFNLDKAPLYVRQAYEKRKWPFVTDYVRLQVIYENGGIYLDTDVELLKNLDDLLNNTAFFGFQTDLYVATGLGFGAEKGCQILKELMQDYEVIPFVRRDGTMDLLPCTFRNNEVFIKHGLIRDNTEQELDSGVRILPASFFCPKNHETGELIITDDTYSIHHYCASWLTKAQVLVAEKRKMYIMKYGVEEGKRRVKNWEKRHWLSLKIKHHGWKGIFGKLVSALQIKRSK